MASKKEQLRQLMRERKEVKKPVKVDSPLAKYDSHGRLNCVVCNITLTESGWSSHLTDRSHKDKLDAIKRNKLTKSSLSSSKTTTIASTTASLSSFTRPVEKRPASSDFTNDGPSCKSIKVGDHQGPNVQMIINQPTKLAEDDEVMEEDDVEFETEEEKRITKSAIKVDFSKLIKPEGSKALEKATKVNPEGRTEPDGESDGREDDEDMSKPNELPKGFFDDPKADAKIRNIPFKDPIDQEMEAFKKAIAEETVRSQSMVEESLEEIQIDRDFEEIEEQINEWAKVSELQRKADQLKAKLASETRKHGDDDIDEDDLDLSEIDVFSNWRNKSIRPSVK